jgi:hypothetical protein
MTIALNLPDIVFARLRIQDEDVVREAEQVLVCGLYREGRLSAPEAMHSLDISSRAAFESLVARHQAQRDWPEEETDQELQTIIHYNRA